MLVALCAQSKVAPETGQEWAKPDGGAGNTQSCDAPGKHEPMHASKSATGANASSNGDGVEEPAQTGSTGGGLVPDCLLQNSLPRARMSGARVVLLGTSGVGKTTLARLMQMVYGEKVNDVRPQQRRTSASAPPPILPAH